jgi:hypothetical protein
MKKRCSLCRSPDHTYRRCPKRPNITARVPVEANWADPVVARLRPIARACIWEPNMLEAIMLSC